jgi:hypothetical protein
MRRKLARIAPWVVTAGLLAYLFSKVHFKELVEATSHAAGWTIPAVLVMVLVIYVADCLAIWKTFGWFVAQLTFRETLALRGATYLLALVNYTLGQGAFVYFLHRTRGVRVARAAAAVLLIMGINVLLLLFLATLGLVLGDRERQLPGLVNGVRIAYGGLVIYIVLVIWKPSWLTRYAALEVLLSAGLVGHMKALVVRVPHTLALLLFNHVALTAFGVHVPWLDIILYLPVVFLAAMVPAVAGLGPVQAAMVFFFARYAPGTTDQREAAVLAASLGSSALAWCVQITLGIVCIRSQLMRTLKDAPKETITES